MGVYFKYLKHQPGSIPTIFPSCLFYISKSEIILRKYSDEKYLLLEHNLSKAIQHRKQYFLAFKQSVKLEDFGKFLNVCSKFKLLKYAA